MKKKMMESKRNDTEITLKFQTYMVEREIHDYLTKIYFTAFIDISQYEIMCSKQI